MLFLLAVQTTSGPAAVTDLARWSIDFYRRSKDVIKESKKLLERVTSDDFVAAASYTPSERDPNIYINSWAAECHEKLVQSEREVERLEIPGVRPPPDFPSGSLGIPETRLALSLATTRLLKEQAELSIHSDLVESLAELREANKGLAQKMTAQRDMIDRFINGRTAVLFALSILGAEDLKAGYITRLEMEPLFDGISSLDSAIDSKRKGLQSALDAESRRLERDTMKTLELLASEEKRLTEEMEKKKKELDELTALIQGNEQTLKALRRKAQETGARVRKLGEDLSRIEEEVRNLEQQIADQEQRIRNAGDRQRNAARELDQRLEYCQRPQGDKHSRREVDICVPTNNQISVRARALIEQERSAIADARDAQVQQTRLRDKKRLEEARIPGLEEQIELLDTEFRDLEEQINTIVQENEQLISERFKILLGGGGNIYMEGNQRNRRDLQNALKP